MRLALATVASAAAAAAVAAGFPAAATSASGLYGRVVISPAFPVCRSGSPCTAPARRVTLAFRRAGRVVARVRTDGAGRYRIALAPGSYSVLAPAHASTVGRGLEPKTVGVPRGRYARVNFTLDVGIR